jgi:Mg/Co/Ni transporter MgtE
MNNEEELMGKVTDDIANLNENESYEDIEKEFT